MRRLLTWGLDLLLGVSQSFTRVTVPSAIFHSFALSRSSDNLGLSSPFLMSITTYYRHSLRRNVPIFAGVHMSYNGNSASYRYFLTCLVGLDHGVGHSLLVLCDANAPHSKKWNNFKVLENYLFNVSISLS